MDEIKDMANPKVEAPQTIKEVGIHIGYLRADVNELKEVVERAANNFATKDELGRLEVRVGLLENRNGIKNTLLWVGLVASAIINIVVIYQLFSGE